MVPPILALRGIVRIWGVSVNVERVGRKRVQSGPNDVYSWCMDPIATLPRPQTTTQPEVRQPRLWNVVLLDDQEHTYEYVMDMVQRLFGHPVERAYMVAKKVDADGRAICLTTHKEHAELKVEQIHSFGADVLIAGCKGGMSAILEPAEFDGDGDEDDRA